jgi:MoxR-like ATPase
MKYPHWLVTKSQFRAGRGEYRIAEDTAIVEMIVPMKQPRIVDENDIIVPEKLVGFVKFGFYENLKKIINSKAFFPIFISGLSGGGKTLAVTQACAELKRELIRFNVSVETDESDLIGSYSLIDGNTVFKDGPVVTAMKRGAVLLIDEIDRGSNKLMAIQGILEGGGFLNKKTGEYVSPTPGFTVIATANTKGQGSEEGRYLAQILDAAFLERFPITVEWNLADNKTERKILNNHLEDPSFIDDLVKWSDVVRQSFENGAIDEYISTRRLVHIAKTYNIFKDKLKAIELCVSRYDSETKIALIDLFTKITEEVVQPEVSEEFAEMKAKSAADPIPF